MAHDGGGVGVGEGDHRGLHPRIVVGQGTTWVQGAAL